MLSPFQLVKHSLEKAKQAVNQPSKQRSASLPCGPLSANVICNGGYNLQHAKVMRCFPWYGAFLLTVLYQEGVPRPSFYRVSSHERRENQRLQRRCQKVLIFKCTGQVSRGYYYSISPLGTSIHEPGAVGNTSAASDPHSCLSWHGSHSDMLSSAQRQATTEIIWPMPRQAWQDTNALSA